MASILSPIDVVKLGKVDDLKLLLNAGLDVNMRDSLEENTLLHIACVNGYLEITQLLLNHQAGIRIKNIYDDMPIHEAIKAGNLDIIHALLHKDMMPLDDLNYTPLLGYMNNTLLHYAAQHNQINVINMLLEMYSKDINAQNIHYDTPLHLAIRAGHVEAIEILLTNGSNLTVRNKDSLTPLLFAVRSNNENIWQLILKNCKNLIDIGEALIYAVGIKDLRMVKQLAIKLFDLKKTNTKLYFNEALYMAVKIKCAVIVKLLLGYGADINAPTPYGQVFDIKTLYNDSGPEIMNLLKDYIK